ncbi:hypothetical protein SeLEV6574_g08047 [Synchytrium endobioticum]|uniref:Expansin-like EG45 domain-containing protein n=1 Tax=Synchytrium endobioticum TaxID=286115 RepID=A0A507C5Y6_9FUNG|nr:hypothetical protein SeLEV6574_g08047 [Synchytrium endobioticum]
MARLSAITLLALVCLLTLMAASLVQALPANYEEADVHLERRSSSKCAGSRKGNKNNSTGNKTNSTGNKLVTSVSSGGNVISGFATWFNDAETQCLGDEPVPEGQIGIAINGVIPGAMEGKFCGKCVQITGPNGTIKKAVVVDVCDPKNCDYLSAKHIDIWGTEAYAVIGNPDDGVVNVKWEWIGC